MGMYGEDTLFTIGEFAAKSGVTLRTLRYYDKIGLLKPCSHKESGHRLYSMQDFARLQKILTFKFIGLSLEDISNIMKYDLDNQNFKKSLELQGKIIDEKIRHMNTVRGAIDEALHMVNEKEVLNWDKFINIINLLTDDKKWSEQYKNASNLRARIRIHEMFSINKYGWMQWFFDRLKLPENIKILELGCGDASLWVKNKDKIPDGWDITLTDFSAGMLEDAKNNLGDINNRFKFKIIDAQDIPYEDNSFDVIIANHMLYHVPDRNKAFIEMHRVLRAGGYFYASTVGKNHMKELRELSKVLDPDSISATEKNLTEVFQLENGFEQVSKWFQDVKVERYKDNLIVTEAEAIIDYIFSIPGNVKEKLNENRLKEFINELEDDIKKTGGIFITKDTGFFQGRKYTA